ncbi:MAG: phosphate ABC transporter permease PstA [Carboxylicivirga sp.]|jgi:phosphate transport system permease protein|nr:phosphate ABC transporter permease PstA [Carboxylicivirga sp.]
MNRKLINKIFGLSLKAAVSICFIVLIFLFGVIAWNGIAAISWDFISESSRNFGAEGGVLYQIIGSILLVIFSAIISFPISLGLALYKSEYLKSNRAHKLSDILIYGLNGIPSVIYGIFGLIFFVNILGTGISWFVGSIILAIMIIPTITLSAYQSINSIPTIYRESALGLGLNKWQVIIKVLLPQGINGAITGLLIGMGRAIGETAPIMFIATAFSGVEYPSSLLEPVCALPTHILALTQQATNPQALQNAWGASLLLVTLVMLFSLSALYLRFKHKNTSSR